MTEGLTFFLANRLCELDHLAHVVESFGTKHCFDPKLTYQIRLVLDEILTNIISYGYEDTAEHSIRVEMNLNSGVLRLVVDDDARPFNPLQEAPQPDVNAPFEKRHIGGLGVHLVKKIMDDASYERKDGRNLLRLSKKID